MLCRKLITFAALVVATINAVVASEPTRDRYNIEDNWRFYWASALDGADADYVTLPHCWSPMLGGMGLVESSANYIREIDVPAEWESRRLFLRFGGVQRTAEVFVNGRYAGSHRGGFTAFTVEITPHVRFGAKNYVRVIVSGSERSDLLPVSSDMDLMAGIYRGVELISTPKSIISLLHYSSDGVYVIQESVDNEHAIGVVRSYLSTTNVDHATLTMRIVGPDGYEVDYRTVRLSKLSPERPVDIPYEITHPQLWSPDSPSLYRIEMTLEAGRSIDRVEVVTGFRDISVDDDNRLCINGEPYDVRGVNMPHDRYGYGLAISEAMLREDVAMACDMGANALRSLSGPHMSQLYDLCDSEGLLAWVDMPFTRSPIAFSDICYYPTKVFHDNGFEQLREIIYQNYNHPSIIMWGLFSLVWQRGDDIVSYVEELNALAHEIDSSRPTVGCSNSDGRINLVTDLIVLRQDVGLYKGRVEDVAVWCRQLAGEQWRTLRSGVCYGEEGIMEHTADRLERATRGDKYIPERRQTMMHEVYSAIIDSVGRFWGVWLDNMFDYSSPRRTYGLNNSGLVCHDHKRCKDAYYLYRAKWNREARTLHIANRRWGARQGTLQQVDIYCSDGTPQLYVNGDTAVVRRIAAGHYRADSVILRGRTRLEARDSLGHSCDIVELRLKR